MYQGFPADGVISCQLNMADNNLGNKKGEPKLPPFLAAKIGSVVFL